MWVWVLGGTRRVGSGGKGPRPPMTYMHICETSCFGMGVFLLRPVDCISLTCSTASSTLTALIVRLCAPGSDALRAKVRDNSPSCLLAPHRGNLHHISALDGPAAFLVILASPTTPSG
ncbi:2-aminoethanethiol dioxygenase-like [Xenopus laevis]|uniref:2-aminoethanethiol dioxygenase-like n=1 Tax=Xenopus laevis TaxID=8355 RepID=A0A8J1LAN6_XENLA|nr:2-aminoethanethiol dioxygenase-like [Xenopus laevis]